MSPVIARRPARCLGIGFPVFAAQTTYPTDANPWSVALADYSSDGIVDAAVSNRTTGTVSVLLGIASCR